MILALLALLLVSPRSLLTLGALLAMILMKLL